MPRQVQVFIQPSGRKIPILDFRYLRLQQEMHTHHSFEICVPFDHLESRAASFMRTAHQELIGKPLTMTFLHHETGFPYELAFSGIVTELVVSGDNDYTGSFIIKGHSPTCLLTDGVQKRTFRNLPLSAIIEQVLQPYPANLLPRGEIKTANTPLPYVVQYNESNFDFLSRLLSESHEWSYYDGKKLQFGTPPQTPPQNMYLDGVWGTYQLETVVVPSKLTLAAYNPESNEHFRADNGTKAEGVDTNHLAAFALKESHTLYSQPSYGKPVAGTETPAALTQTAKTAGTARANAHVLLRGRSDNPSLQLGDVVEVTAEGLGSASYQPDAVGTYRVTSITHYVDEQGNYENSFTGVLHSIPVPPANQFVRPPMAEMELADVVDLQDPLKLGRVRVRYHWPVEKPHFAETGWLRVSTPYTGDGKGQLFTPELGSQVLIGYELHRPEQPLILGNLFHAKNPAQGSYTYPDNSVKSIRTKGGNKITFHDEKGEERILISNGNKKDTALEISFKEDGNITLRTAGSINLSAGTNIVMEAGGEILMAAKKKLEYQAEVVAGIATDKMMIDGGSKITVDSADSQYL